MKKYEHFIKLTFLGYYLENEYPYQNLGIQNVRNPKKKIVTKSTRRVKSVAHCMICYLGFVGTNLLHCICTYICVSTYFFMKKYIKI